MLDAAIDTYEKRIAVGLRLAGGARAIDVCIESSNSEPASSAFGPLMSQEVV